MSSLLYDSLLRFSLSFSLSYSLPPSPEAARHRSEARRWFDKGARHVHPSCTGRLFIPEVKSVAAEAVWTSRRTKSRRTNFGHRLLVRYIRVATVPRRAARSMTKEIRRSRPTSINFASAIRSDFYDVNSKAANARSEPDTIIGNVILGISILFLGKGARIRFFLKLECPAFRPSTGH